MAELLLLRALRAGLLGWLLLAAQSVLAQSHHLQQRWQQLAQQSQLGATRSQALWHLAWESELPARQQDSLAIAAQQLGRQLGDPLDSLTARVWLARSLVYAGQPRPAQIQLLAALPAARRLTDTWLQLQVLLLLGRNQWGSSTHARAETYWLQAWALSQHQPDVALRARVAWLLGTYYVDSGRALDWLYRSLSLAEQAGDQALQVNILNSLAYHYQALEDLPQARAYYTQALEIARQLHSPPALCRALIASGELFAAQGQLAQARQQYREAARYATLPTTHFTLASNLAVDYLQAGAPDSALPYARRARQLAGTLHEVTQSETTLAQLCLQTGQLDSAYYYGQRAYAQRPTGTMQPVVRDLCQILAQTYARQGNWARAYAFERRYQAYQDTLTSAQVRTHASQAQAHYQWGQHQHQAQLWQRDQELARLRRQRTLAATGAAGLLLLGAAGASLLALRRRQARRVAVLRQRLAADLHDEVGALLLRVSLRAELLGSSVPLSAGDAHLLALRADSKQALATLRDVVWSLDAGADTVGGLLDRLREHLDQTAEPAGLPPLVTVTDLPEAQPLTPPLRQHLYLLAKEAITNAVRHAWQASEVRLSLHREGDTLHLTVADNGQPAPLAEKRGGIGLRNMQQRAAAMGGHLTVGPRRDGLGWRVQLRVPLG